jgi:hypothetical protein
MTCWYFKELEVLIAAVPRSKTFSLMVEAAAVCLVVALVLAFGYLPPVETTDQR